MDTKQLQKMYNDHKNVIGLMIVCFLSALGNASLAFASLEEMGRDGANAPETTIVLGVVGALAALSVLTGIGLILRGTWGRVLGIIFSFFCFIPFIANIAMGGTPGVGIVQVVVGIFGLMALFRSPLLFGPERLRGAAVKAELRHRKAHRIP